MYKKKLKILSKSKSIKKIEKIVVSSKSFCFLSLFVFLFFNFFAKIQESNCPWRLRDYEWAHDPVTCIFSWKLSRFSKNYTLHFSKNRDFHLFRDRGRSVKSERLE